MISARLLRAAAMLACATLAAAPAWAYRTPTALIRAVYGPLLAGQPIATPESMLFTEDTYLRLSAWRSVQPVGLGLSPFVYGPYVDPAADARTVSLPFDSRPVAFQVPGLAPARLTSAAASTPSVALSRFDARQLGLSAVAAEVAVSFRNAGAATELLFDLEREADGWRIRDIRSTGPGTGWSLRGVIGATN
jgi:hypothetical protein